MNYSNKTISLFIFLLIATILFFSFYLFAQQRKINDLEASSNCEFAYRLLDSDAKFKESVEFKKFKLKTYDELKIRINNNNFWFFPNLYVEAEYNTNPLPEGIDFWDYEWIEENNWKPKFEKITSDRTFQEIASTENFSQFILFEDSIERNDNYMRSIPLKLAPELIEKNCSNF